MSSIIFFQINYVILEWKFLVHTWAHDLSYGSSWYGKSQCMSRNELANLNQRRTCKKNRSKQMTLTHSLAEMVWKLAERASLDLANIFLIWKVCYETCSVLLIFILCIYSVIFMNRYSYDETGARRWLASRFTGPLPYLFVVFNSTQRWADKCRVFISDAKWFFIHILQRRKQRNE
jgi:hypothetical protein